MQMTLRTIIVILMSTTTRTTDTVATMIRVGVVRPEW